MSPNSTANLRAQILATVQQRHGSDYAEALGETAVLMTAHLLGSEQPDPEYSFWTWLKSLFGVEESTSCGTCFCTAAEEHECNEVGGEVCSCSSGTYPGCERETTCSTFGRVVPKR